MPLPVYPLPSFRDRLGACLRAIVAADHHRPTVHPGEIAGLLLDAAEMVANGMRPGPAGDAISCHLGAMPPNKRERCMAALPLLGLPVGATWSAGPDAANRAVRAMIEAAGGTAETVDYGRALARMAILGMRGIGLDEQVRDLAQFAAAWQQPQRIVAEAAAAPDAITIGGEPPEGADDAIVLMLGLLHQFGPLAVDPAGCMSDALVALAIAGLVGVTAGHLGMMASYAIPAESAHRIDRIVARLALIAHNGQVVPFSGWQQP